ncbi:MAG: arylsulfatase, partial [Planctomycetota bacterium]
VLIAAKTGAVSRVPAWFDKANGYGSNPHAGELYNLRNDIGQKHNLYADYPEKVRELSVRLDEVRAKGQVRH